MLEIFLTSVLPTFLVVAVGIALGPILGGGISTVNRLALYGAAPALVLTSLIDAEIVLTSIARLYGGALLAMIVMFVLARLIVLRAEPTIARGFVATSMFGNAANLMLPVSLFALGPLGLERAVLLFLLMQFLMFAVCPLVLVGRAGASLKLLLGLLKLPVLWAIPVGIVLNLLPGQIPIGLWRGMNLLSDAAIPLVLLVLGLQVYKTGLQLPSGRTWVASLFRMLVGPPVAYAVGWLIGVRDLDLTVLTLLGAMPPAVNILILSLEFGGDAEGTSRTILTATLIALVTLPMVLFFLS
jgi:predicted permease